MHHSLLAMLAYRELPEGADPNPYVGLAVATVLIGALLVFL